jgi:hypothetical protein
MTKNFVSEKLPEKMNIDGKAFTKVFTDTVISLVAVLICGIPFQTTILCTLRTVDRSSYPCYKRDAVGHYTESAQLTVYKKKLHIYLASRKVVASSCLIVGSIFHFKKPDSRFQ